MAPRKPTVPTAPVADTTPAAPVADTAPAAPVTDTTPADTETLPSVIKVKHKVTGKELLVSRRYYDAYQAVLDRV